MIEHIGVEKIMEANQIIEERKVKLVAAVANFCDPETYHTEEDLLVISSEVIVAVGYHPKHASKSTSFEKESIPKMTRLLQHSKVKANRRNRLGPLHKRKRLGLSNAVDQEDNALHTNQTGSCNSL